MVYEELTIPAIQKEWESSFVERYRLFGSERERNHTLEVMIKNQDPFKNTQTHAVTLRIYVKSDTDAEQQMLDLKNP